MGPVGCGGAPAPPCLSSLLLMSALVMSVPTLARPPLWSLHVDVHACVALWDGAPRLRWSWLGSPASLPSLLVTY